jgi:hypothetical protein
LVASNRSLQLLDGTIIAEYYLDGIVEEVNQLLDDAGQLLLTSMSHKFQLPAAMLQQALEQRHGTLFFGRIQGADLYTESFVARHSARVRGVLMAVTRPTVLSTLVKQHSLLDDLAYGMLSPNTYPTLLAKPCSFACALFRGSQTFMRRKITTWCIERRRNTCYLCTQCKSTATISYCISS